MSVGGVAVFPADTVYGLACDVHNRVAVERLYRFKRRRLDKPSAVMFFDRELALAALPELGERTRAALGRLLPGPVTVLLPNPERRFPLACGEDLSDVRAAGARRARCWQGSRGRCCSPAPTSPAARTRARWRRCPRCCDAARTWCSTAASCPGRRRRWSTCGHWRSPGSGRSCARGRCSREDVAAALEWQFHFDPSSYAEMIHEDIPVYDAFQDAVVGASGSGASRVLELGTGTGETARRLLARHPDAFLVGVDESASMLAAAREALDGNRVSLQVGAIEQPLPEGPFDLVASALCVHHLEGALKRDLFARVRAVLAPGGRFVLGDVVVPVDAADAVTSLTPGFDHPSPLADQLEWLAETGFDARVVWEHQDLAVIVASDGRRYYVTPRGRPAR